MLASCLAWKQEDQYSRMLCARQPAHVAPILIVLSFGFLQVASKDLNRFLMVLELLMQRINRSNQHNVSQSYNTLLKGNMTGLKKRDPKKDAKATTAATKTKSSA